MTTKKINSLEDLRRRKAELRASMQFSADQVRHSAQSALPSFSDMPTLLKVALPAAGGFLLTRWLKKKSKQGKEADVVKALMPLVPMLIQQFTSSDG